VKFSPFLRIAFLIAVLVSIAVAQEPTPDLEPNGTPAPAPPGDFFSFKVPDGFQQETTDDTGIARWKKGAAEIHLVVGDLFTDSDDSFFDALQSTSERDKRLEGITTQRLDHGRWLLLKEKAPDDPERVQVWRLVVVTSKKVINLDFAAPGKDFGSHAQEFMDTIASFNLKSPS
jgi:hypothetical protein